MRLALVLVATVVSLLAFPAPAPAEDPPTVKGDVASLAWLEGQWRSAGEGDAWEACYSGPEGGEIVSATKRIKGGKVTLFDFERFREEDGTVVLTPFPHGVKSVDFALVALDPVAKRAIFDNPGHDFPTRMRYEVGEDGHLRIAVMGKEGDRYVGFTLDLVRKP
jgi:hypothetical protein